jgi:hypothetical protein
VQVRFVPSLSIRPHLPDLRLGSGHSVLARTTSLELPFTNAGQAAGPSQPPSCATGTQ